MSRGAMLIRGASTPVESRIGFAAVVFAGCGAAAAAGGLASGNVPLALGGGALLLCGLGVLLVGEWVAGLPVLAIALVLPAPFATESFRLSAAAIVTAVFVVAWCLRRGVDGERVRSGALPVWAVASLMGAVALASAFALSPLPAARELVTFVFLLGLLVAATDELARDPARPARLARLLAVVAAAAGPLAALEALGLLPGRFPLPGTAFNRATLGFGWPNELGMFFALSVPLGAWVWWTARGAAARVLAAMALAGIVMGLAATFSRGSWLAVPAGAAALFLVREGRLAVRIWVAAFLGAVALDLVSGGAVTGRLGALPGDWVVEQRAALVLTGLIMFRAHPVVGVGPGGFAEHLERFGPQVSWLWDYVGSAHNSFVHVAAETGLIGLLAFVAFLAAVFLAHLRGARRPEGERSDDRPLRLALVWALGIVLALCMLEWILAHGVGQLIVLVAAMGFALDQQRGQHRAAAGPAPPGRAARGGGGGAS